MLSQAEINPPVPTTGYLRLAQIIGSLAASPRKKTNSEDRKSEAPFYLPLIPVSRSSWLEGVKTGRYPKSVKLSSRSVAWKAEDIRQLIEQLAK